MSLGGRSPLEYGNSLGFVDKQIRSKISSAPPKTYLVTMRLLRGSNNMSRQKTKEEIEQHCNQSLKSLRLFLQDTIDTQDPMLSDKLAYWIEDYTKFMRLERKVKQFVALKRGSVIKAHLGFRIGSEEGGLHYCVVLCDSGVRQRVVQVVPLTSQKPKHDLNNLPEGSISIGNELFQKLYIKAKSIYDECKNFCDSCTVQYNKLEDDYKNGSISHEFFTSQSAIVSKQLEETNNRMKEGDRSLNEIKRLKFGSIALVNQIVTISKLRIYDPLNKEDSLSGISLSSVTLDKIDEAIIKLMTNKKTNDN